MPNQYQVAYLGSFFLSFSTLVLLSRWLTNKLSEAGYPIGNLILIGLDNNPNDDMASQAEALRNFPVPGLGTVDILALATSPAFVFTSAVILSTAVYIFAFHSGRTKPLDPNAWKEFALEKKIVVSPNTAMYVFLWFFFPFLIHPQLPVQTASSGRRSRSPCRPAHLHFG